MSLKSVVQHVYRNRRLQHDEFVSIFRIIVKLLKWVSHCGKQDKLNLEILNLSISILLSFEINYYLCLLAHYNDYPRNTIRI